MCLRASARIYGSRSRSQRIASLASEPVKLQQQRRLVDMAIEEALIARLAGVAGGRVHWGWAESVSPTAGPYVRLSWISGPRDYTMSGPTRHTRRRLQLDAYGLTCSACRAVADAARPGLSGFRGAVRGVRIEGDRKSV